MFLHLQKGPVCIRKLVEVKPENENR